MSKEIYCDSCGTALGPHEINNYRLNQVSSKPVSVVSHSNGVSLKAVLCDFCDRNLTMKISYIVDEFNSAKLPPMPKGQTKIIDDTNTSNKDDNYSEPDFDNIMKDLD